MEKYFTAWRFILCKNIYNQSINAKVIIGLQTSKVHGGGVCSAADQPDGVLLLSR